MKKLAVIFGVVFSIGLTSCFQHRVCATYVKNDVKQSEKPASTDLDEKI